VERVIECPVQTGSSTSSDATCVCYVEIIKEVPVERVVTIEKEVPIEIYCQSPIDRVIEVIKEVPTTRIEEKIVTVKSEELKTVEVEKIVERNVETIKEVHSGPERIVYVHVDRIVEVPILVNVTQVLTKHYKIFRYRPDPILACTFSRTDREAHALASCVTECSRGACAHILFYYFRYARCLFQSIATDKCLWKRW